MECSCAKLGCYVDRRGAGLASQASPLPHIEYNACKPSKRTFARLRAITLPVQAVTTSEPEASQWSAIVPNSAAGNFPVHY